MRTVVINLLGGSGIGKTTVSSGLFYYYKCEGRSIELVREYVKQWAWEGKKVGPFDQPYIFGKQLKMETSLYGKVQYIVTDSPLLLSPMYEMFYNGGESLVYESCMKHMAKAKATDVHHINFMINRTKPYNPAGRYEDETAAKKFDEFLKTELNKLNISFIETTGINDDEKVKEIMNYMNVLEHKVLS